MENSFKFPAMDASELLKAENARLKTALHKAQVELSHSQQEELTVARYKELIGSWKDESVEQPSWTLRPSQKSRHECIPVLLLGDVHFAEVVDPLQVNGANQYSLPIARNRLRWFFETSIHLAKSHIGSKYPGITVAMLGDMFSGDIHEDLRATNEVSVPEALLDLQGILAWGLTMLADQFKHVNVSCVVGNHGRLDFKPWSKDAVTRSWDWLLYQETASMLRSDKRITWNISDAVETQFKVYSTVFNTTHGDCFKGGGGIQGALSPWMIGDYRKRKRAQAMNADYDYLVFGHWHKSAHFAGLIANGTVKGYDEYAFRKNFEFEPPQQWMFLVRPDGRVMNWIPIFLDPAARG